MNVVSFLRTHCQLFGTIMFCATEVLSPPRNISASVKDGDLLVTWDLPRSRADYNPSCFEYQLDFGEQVYLCVDKNVY